MKKAILAVVFLSLISSLAYGQLNLGLSNSNNQLNNTNSQNSLVFTENRGQWGESTLYRAEAPGVVLYLCGNEIAYKLIRKIEQPAESADFPYVNAYDTSYNSAQDVFVAKFSYGQACNYVPGDINGDGQCIGTDVIYAVRYFKMNGLPPVDSCYLDSTLNYIYTTGDCNADCRFTGSDIMRLVAYFKGIAPIEPCRFFPPE